MDKCLLQKVSKQWLKTWLVVWICTGQTVQQVNFTLRFHDNHCFCFHRYSHNPCLCISPYFNLQIPAHLSVEEKNNNIITVTFFVINKFSNGTSRFMPGSARTAYNILLWIRNKNNSNSFYFKLAIFLCHKNMKKAL